MAVFLSLLAAASFGTGDFCGGLASKRASVLHVVAGSHVVGLVGVVVAALLVADGFRIEDFLLGMAGGVFGGVGVGLLYRGLARGPMAVVAPLTAITSAAVPAAWGIGFGDDLSVLAGIGVLLALVAIGLVSATRETSAVPVTARVVVESLAAGGGFGGFFIFVDAAAEVSAPWPIVGARTITSAALLLFFVVARRPLAGAVAGAGWLIVLTGVFDTGSNVMFLYASEQGLLTLVAVLTSLYPVSTVILARVVLHERMSLTQLWGFAAAMGATVLIAAG